MKMKAVLALKAGDKVVHNRYGLCEVGEVKISRGSLFGVIVRPVTDASRSLLARDSGTQIPDLLEDSIRRLSEVEP